MKKLLSSALMIGLTLCLAGCIFVAGAAAGAAAIAIVYDHRTLTNMVKDTHIANKIATRIRMIAEPHDENHIQVTVFHRVVLLTGETPNPAIREQAEVLAKANPDVKRVYNQILIQGPTSTLTRTSDYWITGKIKGEMLATDELRSGSIKVVTENGIVYLMGVVTHLQADIAVDIARQVSGVQRVVKVFAYTS